MLFIMQYQEINELLAKGIKIETMSADDARVKEIKNANLFLTEHIGGKPDWLDGFLESNRCKLVETIYRITAGREGIASLQGYREGYFNEIVQNVNDLHCGDNLSIHVSRKENICELNCEYKDTGFKLSNIYAFLNREMSDKISNERQTGKFGIGIKSFFKFVDKLSIQSNVKLEFFINRSFHNHTVYGSTEYNSNWDGKYTKLNISYNITNETEFNICKLTDFVDYLCGRKEINVGNFFISGNDNELIFDIRSLLFMRMHSQLEEPVSKLTFYGNMHTISMECDKRKEMQDITIDGENWSIGTMLLKMKVDNKEDFYKKEYIVFLNNGISIAFPVGVYSSEKNRMYSTYYLKEDTREQLLAIGMLVDSEYANMCRNDVGDSEESINRVYDEIRKQMKKLYVCMCSKEAASLSCAVEISDVFHHLLARYVMVKSEQYLESPLSDYCYNNSYLPKIKEKEDNIVRSYVVFHKPKEEYDTSAYQEGNIAKELKENYFDFVEKKDVYDIESMLSEKDCILGVKKLYEILSDNVNEYCKENIRIASEIANYFDSVGSFIAYSISGERKSELKVTDAEVERWLIYLRETVGTYYNPEIFLKLVGRYKLNDAVAYTGSIIQSNLSFQDYLFNGILETEEGILTKYQNKQFDETYFELKQELLQKRYVDTNNKQDRYAVRCMKPIGRSASHWNQAFDYYEMSAPKEMEKKLSEPELLLEKMAIDDNFTQIKLDNQELRLFEKCSGRMSKRAYLFKNYITICQQIINLNCLKHIQMDTFSKFMKAIKYRYMLENDLKKFIGISCKQSIISTMDIVKEVLPIMVEIQEHEKKTYLLDEFSSSEVEICDIEENNNNEILKENAEFIYKITGYYIHLYKFDSSTRRKIIAFFGNGKCAIQAEASKAFREVAKYTSSKQDIYIFYDNFVDNFQELVSIVLSEIGIEDEDKKLKLLNGYIHNGNNTKTVNYISRKSLAKVKKKLALNWARLDSNDISPVYDSEIIYRLLTARGSYDIFCPICADIPLETFDYGGDTKKRKSRYIIVLENENPVTNSKAPYIITIACSYCQERLRNTLIKSEFDEKNIVLTTQIAHGLHEKMRSRQQIELSPVNVELMKNFKKSLRSDYFCGF